MAIWNRLISVLDKTVLQWIFPPLCIHCSELTDENRYFCRECLDSIDDCFLYLEDPQLCKQLRGKKVCIAFENMGPLYTLARESHSIYKKLFIEFVKLAYLQSNLFGCDGIIYYDIGVHATSIAGIAKAVGLALCIPVYKVSRVEKKLYLPLLLYWQFPTQREYIKIENELLKNSIKDKNILIFFNQYFINMIIENR